ncbi:MAG: PIG-L deacetylase family protein [Trueperaceae bacterium]|nr:PIG-L deacetylase family protein [Trueperaceae bacterium]
MPVPADARRRLLAVFAHPDDETFVAGGTLARYAATGNEVTVVCATSGELGRRGEYVDLPRPAFADVRRGELEAACAALGTRPPRFLGCTDKGLDHDCQEAATAEVADIIEELRPDVVVTFGPDGVSGHADHLAIGQIVTAAFARAGRSLPAPAPGTEHAHPVALYYVLRSEAAPACCAARDGAPPPPPTTTSIDVRGYGDRKLAAVRCHRSQHHLQPATPEREAAILSAPEAFHRAVPAWTGGSLETHLFGLTEAATTD